MTQSKGFIYTLLSSLNWAIAIILTRIVLSSGENPYNLTFWTMLLALPYWLWVGSKELIHMRKLTRKDVGLLSAIALINAIGVSFLEVFALKYSSAVNYSFLFRTVTAFTIVFAYFFLGEPITKKKIILLVLLMTGSFFLTTRGQGIRLSAGDIFTLSEAALVALGTGILAKIAAGRMSADTAAVGRYAIGLLPVLIIASANAPIRIPANWSLVAAITVLNMVFLQTMFRAFQYVSASYFTMIMSFTPVFVAFMAVPFLAETLTGMQIVGGGLILLAGIFVEKLKI